MVRQPSEASVAPCGGCLSPSLPIPAPAPTRACLHGLFSPLPWPWAVFLLLELVSCWLELPYRHISHVPAGRGGGLVWTHSPAELLSAQPQHRTTPSDTEVKDTSAVPKIDLWIITIDNKSSVLLTSIFGRQQQCGYQSLKSNAICLFVMAKLLTQRHAYPSASLCLLLHFILTDKDLSE